MTTTNWQTLATKKSRLAIGLMSGTSCDGVDAALVAIRGTGAALKAKLLCFHWSPYPASIRKRLQQLTFNESEICLLNVELARHFAIAVKQLRAAAIRRGFRRPPDFVASHGHTIAHLPAARARSAGGATLQIGEPAVIAELTGLPVVSNFRERDLAAGGQGAPLVPYVDWLLFRRPRRTVVCLNIGGIANCTFVTPSLDRVVAFDTGPGNMPIDGLVQSVTRGRRSFDSHGELASSGIPDHLLVARMLRHPYFRKSIPKSTGRDMFDANVFCRSLLRGARGLSSADRVATITDVVARSIAEAIGKVNVSRGYGANEIIVSGGGAHNAELMQRIRVHAFPMKLTTSSDYGWPVDAKEAVAFAILGNETVCGTPANVPQATGSTHPAVLGRITPA